MNDDASEEQPVLYAVLFDDDIDPFLTLLVVGYGDGGVGVRV